MRTDFRSPSSEHRREVTPQDRRRLSVAAARRPGRVPTLPPCWAAGLSVDPLVMSVEAGSSPAAHLWWGPAGGRSPHPSSGLRRSPPTPPLEWCQEGLVRRLSCPSQPASMLTGARSPPTRSSSQKSLCPDLSGSQSHLFQNVPRMQFTGTTE